MISEIDTESDSFPKIEVIVVEEQEDGSAICQLKTNPAGTKLLMEWGFNALLKKALDEVHPDC